MGRDAEPAALFRETAEIQQRTLGPDHRSTLVTFIRPRVCAGHRPRYLPCAPVFAAGTEIATESGCVQAAVPLVKSRRCMVILRLP